MFKINLKDNEQILQTYRQSKWILFSHAILASIAIFIPINLFFDYNLYPKYDLFAIIWTLIWVLYLCKQLIPWLLKRYIITDQRVIIIFHESIFKKNVLEAPLDRILNVSYKNTGLFSSMIGFGNVEIQAVGLAEMMRSLSLDNISDPESTKDYLWQIHESYLQDHLNTSKVQSEKGSSKR